MASVQELLLAAESRNRAHSPFSPLLDIANTAFGAYDEGVQMRSRNLALQKQQIELQQMKQEVAAQKEMQAQIKARLAAQNEAKTKNAARVAAGGAPIVEPAQKLNEEIKQDEKGKFSRTWKETDGAAVKVPKTYEEGLMAEVAAGKMSLDEAGRRKAAQAQGTPDKSMARAITKAKVDLATIRPMVSAVLSEIERVEKLNADSYGGLTGEAQMKVRSKLNVGTDGAKFKNTSDIVNTMQAQVAKVLKSTFGAQLSDGERQYLNQIYGALPSLSQTERAIAMKNVKTMLNGRLEAAKSTLSELQADGGSGAGGGGDAEDGAGALTPEEEADQFLKGL
jgi:hypothetical protein